MNAVDNAGWTPLFEAIREHKEGTTLDVIRALVAAGADVNAKSPPDDGGGTVLHNLASKAHYMAIAKVMRRNTYSGVFLGVLAKTQFVQNAKTQFENTQFES